MKRMLTSATALALTIAAGATLAAGAAQAQSYGRLVVFGDSLSDNGNLFIASGGTQPPSPPFAQRFSNGPVWAELLGFNAVNFNGSVAGSYNTAFGGARTDFTAFPPGARLQLQNYQAAGGVFTPSTLTTVWIGANDIFQGLPGAAASPNPAGAMATIAGTAATNAGFVVNAAASGGGTVLVGNLPQLSTTPQFAGSPAAPLADFAVSQFNSALNAQLQAASAANPNANIILFDVNRVGSTIIQRASAFGLTNVTQPCFNGVTVCSNPNQYFYFDGVHPTARGHQLIAALATDYLYYRNRAMPTALLAETSTEHRQGGFDQALSMLRAPGGEDSEGVGLIVQGGRSEGDARGFVSASERDAYAVRLVLAKQAGAWRMGAQFSLDKSETTAGALSFDTESLSADGFVGWSGERVFVNAVFGVGRNDFEDVTRLTALAPITHTASTKGMTWGGGVEVGARLGALTPRVGLTAFDGSVDAYQETGPAARHSIGERQVQGLTGEAAVRWDGDMGGMKAFAEVGYRDWLSYDGDPVSVALVDNTADRLTGTVEEPGGTALVDLGLSTTVLERIEVGLSYRGRIGDTTDSHAGILSARLAF